MLPSSTSLKICGKSEAFCAVPPNARRRRDCREHPHPADTPVPATSAKCGGSGYLRPPRSQRCAVRATGPPVS